MPIVHDMVPLPIDDAGAAAVAEAGPVPRIIQILRTAAGNRAVARSAAGDGVGLVQADLALGILFLKVRVRESEALLRGEGDQRVLLQLRGLLAGLLVLLRQELEKFLQIFGYRSVLLSNQSLFCVFAAGKEVYFPSILL